MPAAFSYPPHSWLQKQRGAALMVMLVILILGATAMLLSALNNTMPRLERDKVTADALAQAREALIGYATSVKLSSTGATRPGDLPCPDNHPIGDPNEGSPSTPCDAQAARLGRLPWKKLGLPDLRDSSGERLWYAVSNNFKNSSRIGTLNSDTSGNITVRDSSGNIINNGCTAYALPLCPAPNISDAPFGTGAVAVIIAPREILQRQGGTLQDRSSTSYNTPGNYLDIATAGGNTQDNASSIDSTSTNGLIQGRIKDSNNNTSVNDQLLVITQDNIMQAVEKRVAAEVKKCLNEYSANNNNRYPWAVPLNDTTYHDRSNQLFGRIPDDLTHTQSDFGGSISSGQWGAACTTHFSNAASSWWQNWRAMVFYGLADAYKPAPPLPVPACGTCLVVTSVSATSDKKIVVIVAGKMLSTQTSRLANQSSLNNYLELPNSGGATTFSQSAPSANFNDTVVFQ